MVTRIRLTGFLFTALVSLATPTIRAAVAAGDFPPPSVVLNGTPTSADEPSAVEVFGGYRHLSRLNFGTSEPANPIQHPRLTWGDSDMSVASLPTESDAQAQAPRHRPVAVQYSSAYAVRAKIHKWGSYATLPLFGAQAVLGMQLDEGTTSEAVRATHAGIATAMVGLFGVNSVTGLWNLWEGRKDPNGRTKRVTHGILMLGADAGFVATGLLAPTNDGGGNRDLHKTVAFTSIGVATAGYLLMLLTK